MKKRLSIEEIHDGSFNVLLKIKEICEKNDIKYWLSYGTLIGAVRHHGFIPWDDDIDIQMPREDYEKFIEYCINNSRELYPYELLHYKTNKNYPYAISRFSDSRYEITEYKGMKEYGLGLFVDIYPMDECDINNSELIETRKLYIKTISINAKESLLFNKIVKIVLKLFYCHKMGLKKSYEVLEEYDNLFKKGSFGKGNYSCYLWENNIYNLKREDFYEIIQMPFCGEKFNVPKEYDSILKCLYGNYMELPPEKDRVGHHFYKAYIKERKNDK